MGKTPNQDTPLVITKAVLKELEKIALTERVEGIHELEYVQAQQVMVINALIKWIQTYGLQSQFTLDLE